MVEYLVDRAVKTKNTKNNSDNKMVSELKIENGKIYFQYLNENFWSELISLEYVINKTSDELINSFEDNILVPDNIKTDLKQIKRDLNFSWDEKAKKFKVDYNLNKFGQIHELYIPTGKNYINKIVIAEIYDDSGNFVAHELEDKINVPLYKIESMNLYANTLTDENIEEKRRKEILDIATNMTMYDQGDNRLHNKITHRLED